MSGVRRQVVVSTLSLQGLLGSKGGMEGGGGGRKSGGCFSSDSPKYMLCTLRFYMSSCKSFVTQSNSKFVLAIGIDFFG